MLYDGHGRVMNYLRLAVTDRCNLRCRYCMPECGIDFLERTELLTFEEMLRIVRLLAKEGVSKIRITGGEPFVRKNLMTFLSELKTIPDVQQVHITTNGTLMEDKIDALAELGLTSINLSLDSLDSNRFFRITRRDELPTVLHTLERMLQSGFDIKINMVVMAGINTEDIIPMLELAKERTLSVRFLEEMPFNGIGLDPNSKPWNHNDILQSIQRVYPDIKPLSPRPHSTSMNYQIEGFEGSFGIIASYSRTFCGSCNRIRLTPQGMMRTCLYDQGALQLRDALRSGMSDAGLLQHIQQALHSRAKDGYEAESRRGLKPISESMASIGG